MGHLQLLRPICRSYASQARKRPTRLESTISLDHFLQRSKALSLWRSIVRGCKKISDPSTKAETLRFAKEEFVRNKEVKDYADTLLDFHRKDAVGDYAEVY